MSRDNYSSIAQFIKSIYTNTMRKEKNIQAATVYYKSWSGEVQEIFDKKGIKLYIYTVNNLKEAQGYIQKGAAGVCSDYLQDTDFE